MADLGQLNVFNEVGIGDIGFVLLVFALAVVIVGLIGLLLFVYITKKEVKIYYSSLGKRWVIML